MNCAACSRPTWACIDDPCPRFWAVIDHDLQQRALLADPAWQAWHRQKERLENDRRLVRARLRRRLLNDLEVAFGILHGEFDPWSVARVLHATARLADAGAHNWAQATDAILEHGPAPGPAANVRRAA
jgi:hypothetical protein